jgi:hypothetical protein
VAYVNNSPILVTLFAIFFLAGTEWNKPVQILTKIIAFTVTMATEERTENFRSWKKAEAEEKCETAKRGKLCNRKIIDNWRGATSFNAKIGT